MRFRFAPEKPQDAARIEDLLGRVFGPGRFARAAERLREGNLPVPGLSLTAWEGKALVGTIRFWPVWIGTEAGLLLGPLAVEKRLKGKGAGLGLIRSGCEAAKSQGHTLVLLVGDPPYYARADFHPAARGSVLMPGPVDPARILICTLGRASAPSGRVMMRRSE